MFLVFTALFLLCRAVGAARIVNLPGAPEGLSFGQYSGYIVVNATVDRKLFFWFVEAESEPEKKPVFLWLNGGPGCSSLGGLLSENGPLFPSKDGKYLYRNPHSWNKAANVIYLESPAGVGFSSFSAASDNEVGDERTTQDSLVFLNEFFKEFAQFSKNEFWITGESYGGHYVPNLALAISRANSRGTGIKINLQGFMVGNAWTVPALDNQGASDFWLSHALNSRATHDGIKSTCDFSLIGPLRRRALSTGTSVYDKDCNYYLSRSSQEMGPINIYDIYADVCLKARYADGQQLVSLLADGQETLIGSLGSQQPPYDPCIQNDVNSYLNREDVQIAIHAVPNSLHNRKWQQCSSTLNYSRSDLLTPMLPVYEELLNEGLRLLVYSGDVDGIVPYTGTSEWIRKLGLGERSAWRPWKDSSGQVGGYVTEYEGGLTFATVRNAGHMVPYTQPERALDMVKRFTANTPL